MTGRSSTAEDVAFTYNAILDQDSASPLATILDSLEQARAVDATTVEFDLNRPDPAFFDKLQVGIVPAHALKGQDIKTAAFNRRPIGTGPYVIKEFQPGGRIVMEANPRYFRGAPQIKRLVFTAVPDENARVALLEKGAVDAAGIVPKLAGRARENGNYNVLEVRTADARVAALPTRDPVLRDAEVRRALSFAVNREQLVAGCARGRRRACVRPDHEGPLGLRPGRRGRRMTRPRPSAGWTRRATRERATARGSRSRSCTPPPTASARTSRSASRPIWPRSASRSSSKGTTFDVIEKRQDEGAAEFGYGTPYDPDLELYWLFHSKFATADEDAYTNYPRTTQPFDRRSAGRRALDARRRRP